MKLTLFWTTALAQQLPPGVSLPPGVATSPTTATTTQAPYDGKRLNKV